jgi:hypothetical protein
LEKVGDILCLLTNVSALVLSLFVDELKLLERLDDVDIVFEIHEDVLGAGVKEIIKDGERLDKHRT